MLVGWAVGDIAAGLIATIGAFTSLYGSGRPYLNRGLYLGVVAVSFAVAVALGDWASAVPWLGVLTVSVIAMVAALVCHALTIGPPGAYMFVLACAAGVGAIPADKSPWHVALLVLAGGAFAWSLHMAAALVRPRGPEKAAVAAAGTAIAQYIEAIGGDAADEAQARHQAAQLLYDAWITLVNFQPVQPKPDTTLYRLRRVSRRLHVLFAEAMSAAENAGPLSPDAAALARHLATVPADAADDEPGAAGQTPLGRPSAILLLRRALTPGSASLQLAGRVGIAVVISGAITSALGISHAYWAMAAAVLMLHQGFDWLRTLQRAVERTLGTWVGLGAAGVILALHPQGLWLALTIGVLQFVIEMYVVRNYTLAVIFITPAALTIASGGRPVDDVVELLLARGFDTLIGCAVALLVYRLTLSRRASAGPAEAVAAALDAVAVAVRHLASGAVTTAQARADRRDLQLRAIEMLAAYDAGIGGSAQQRVAAERLWPALVATEQLAYRTLAACWAVEHGGAAPVSPQNSRQLSTALAELARAVRTGKSPEAVAELPQFGEAEVRTVRESLVCESRPR